MCTGKKSAVICVLILLMSWAIFSPNSSFSVNVSQAATDDILSGNVIVLVNSSSASYSDFQHYIQPYLDNFGIPYTVWDITVINPIGLEIGDYAAIIIGHRQIDPTGLYLDPTEQTNISTAVAAGTGLVNFDNDLSADSSTARYQFIEDVFGFTYLSPSTTSDVTFPAPEGHYITERHLSGETITTDDMTMAGISLPTGMTELANSGAQPFLAVIDGSSGRAIQWGTYDWIRVSVKGPLYGFDDLVWRSIVWVARKPFVLQGIPPFITLRIDDQSGDLWAVDIANEYGYKPWMGVFSREFSDAQASHLSDLVYDGWGTASIHAFRWTEFFYWDHYSGTDFSDSVLLDHFVEGTQWHQDHDIPISKFLLAHFAEIGINAFEELQDWGIEFLGTFIEPSVPWGSSWIAGRPYHLYESQGVTSENYPFYYADYYPIPGHLLDGEFFNCLSNIRDAGGREWYPTNDVSYTVERGTKHLKRMLDSMVLGTLFTHDQEIQPITPENWRAILEGINNNMASYNPSCVTMDDACQYIRAIYDSDITAASYDTDSRQLTVTITGETDTPTMFYLFTEESGQIPQVLVDVPVIIGSTDVIHQLAGPLDYITVTPDPATMIPGSTQQFKAQGYDADDLPIPGLVYDWSVVSGGGSIDNNGLFTAGATTGTYPGTIRASVEGIQGFASVEILEPFLSHFTFEPIQTPQYEGIPFSVSITANDLSGTLLDTYNDTAALSDSTGTINQTVTGSFSNGLWEGDVIISQVGQGITITVSDGSAVGTSNAFDVQPVPGYYQVTSTSYDQDSAVPFTVTVTAPEITINLWEDNHQDPVLETIYSPDLPSREDNAWGELKWDQRDYPGVFAGKTETPGLMKFYGTVPNGTYQIIANLYSNHFRYFFGFQSDLPQEFWVVTDDTEVDFAEYDLGTVTVTNNQFALYTDYAEDMGSSALSYGWAWIRLVPVPEYTINCWEDNHQDPILETQTTAPSRFDNEWGEFKYALRDYPGIFAGKTETPGLMKFYGTVPNGTYQIIANLYSNHFRYFFGFQSDLPQEFWVVTDDTEVDFAEYDLGTVAVTNNEFALYTDYAQDMGSSALSYGWAWIRLVPAVSMSSSSATMFFDGDGDSIFGELNDVLGFLEGDTFSIQAVDTVVSTGVSITATGILGGWGSALYNVSSPTAVILSSFAAKPQVNTIRVSWRTASEIDLLGFNLYRSDMPDDPLNETLVLANAPGDVSGSSYQFTDWTVDAGEVYEYTLEIVTLSGRTKFKPVSVTAQYAIFVPLLQH